jgi:hypothetical protein
MSRAREAVEGVKWQGTEKLWTNRVGKNWVAKRVLGRGGQGIVGHWLVSCSAEISPRKQIVLCEFGLEDLTTSALGLTKVQTGMQRPSRILSSNNQLLEMAWACLERHWLWNTSKVLDHHI